MRIQAQQGNRGRRFVGWGRPRPWLAALGLVLQATMLPPTPAAAQPAITAVEATTPRAAMLGYLEAARAGDYERASAYLDVQGLPHALRANTAMLARQLKAVLDRTLWIDLDTLRDEAEGQVGDGLAAHRDLVGTIDSAKGAVPVYLDRVALRDGTHQWKIATVTLARVPALYDEFGYGPLGDYLPPVFFEQRVLEVQLWQWIGLAILITVAITLSALFTSVVVHLIRAVVIRRRLPHAERMAALSIGPLRLLVATLLFAAGLYSLGLAVPVLAFFGAVDGALLAIAVTWFLGRTVDVAAAALEQHLIERGQPFALSAVPLGRRTLKVLVWLLATLIVLQNFDINVTGLVAGLGIGGLAVALAAQKTVENFFGGVTLITDQPVRVGDFCRFGDRVGTIEDVGLRSTRVRTLDRTVVTIPNAAFASMELENFAKRDRIWFHPTIGLRYETTPDQLRHVLVELKKLLVAHPHVSPDPARVRFVGFGAYSLDLEIFAYVLTSDYNQFLAIREDLLLRIMDVVERSGTGFAFPSQTIYAGADGGLDADKQRAAVADVQRWRESNDLGLPFFRPEQLQAVQHTLDYPPVGSAVRAPEA